MSKSINTSVKNLRFDNETKNIKLHAYYKEALVPYEIRKKHIKPLIFDRKSMELFKKLQENSFEVSGDIDFNLNKNLDKIYLSIGDEDSSPPPDFEISFHTHPSDPTRKFSPPSVGDIEGIIGTIYSSILDNKPVPQSHIIFSDKYIYVIYPEKDFEHYKNISNTRKELELIEEWKKHVETKTKNRKWANEMNKIFQDDKNHEEYIKLLEDISPLKIEVHNWNKLLEIYVRPFELRKGVRGPITNDTRTRTRFGKSKSNDKKPQKRPSSAVCTRAQKLGVRLTLKRNNKRVYKSEEMLRVQIKNAVTKRKSKQSKK